MRTDFGERARTDPAFASSEAQVRKCVHCGFCQSTCPTYTLLGDELDSPRGRIYLMKDMLENAREPSQEVVKHIDRCLSCLSCMTTCPSGVNYMHLVDHARAYIQDNYRRPLIDRFWRWLLAAVLPYPGRMKLAIAGARMARPFKSLLKPMPPLEAMLSLAPDRAAPAVIEPRLGPAGVKPRAVLLGGCAEPVLRPEIRAATVRLLERAGFDVGVAPESGCCGALVHHLGRTDDAHAAAKRNIDAWTREIEDGGLAAIVITASGCGTVIKDYGFMFRDDPDYAEKAARVSALAKDITELLDQHGLPPVVEHPKLTVAYLSACSLQHGQRVTLAPKRLLAAAGFEVREPKESHLCCGSAGTYNILQPEISAQLRDRKVANLAATGGQVLSAGNIGCLTQIGERAGMPAVHTVELLDWATGGPKPAGIA